MPATRWWSTLVLASCWLVALPAAAEPFAESQADAEASESGIDPGFDTDSDSSSTPGGSSLATAYRCPGDQTCTFLPGEEPLGGRGYAETDYGSNRASSRAAEGYGAGDDSVANSASASSFWADEWTFDVASPAAGQAVSIDIHLDGFWTNFGFAEYGAGIGQRIVPAPEPNPEDPPPFLLPDVELLAGLTFTTTHWNGGPGDGEGDPAGSVDEVFTFSFVPEAGETYVMQARLDARSVGRPTGGETQAGFDSTAALVRVVVPEGISFVSAAGADYTVQVPEPAAALLLLAGGALLAARRGFARR